MSEKIKQSVARLVLRAPVTDPRSNLEVGKEVALTVRPGWSKQGKYELALPGGKFDVQDFSNGVPEHLTFEDMVQAGMLTVVREIFEELGIEVSHQLLRFVFEVTNQSGWTSYVYAVDVTEKPPLIVLPESAGTLWVPEQALLEGRVQLFADHGELVIPALQLLQN